MSEMRGRFREGRLASPGLRPPDRADASPVKSIRGSFAMKQNGARMATNKKIHPDGLFLRGGAGAANLAMQYGHPSRCPNSLGSTVSFRPHFGQLTVIPLPLFPATFPDNATSPSCCQHYRTLPEICQRGVGTAVLAIRFVGVPFAFVAIAHHE